MKKLLIILCLSFGAKSFAQIGATCATPLVIGTLPFNMAGVNTSTFGNDYSSADACGSVYMNGNDFVLEYIPTADTCITITISNTIFSTGLFLIKNCPDVSSSICIDSRVGSNNILTATVEQDSIYYIIVSTDSFPASTVFDINIQEIECLRYKNFDCFGATRICADYNVPTTYPDSLGIDPNEINSGNTCLSSGEFGSSNWYEFTSFEDGFLGFTIVPFINEDFDWAVFDITASGCEGVFSGNSPVVSCNYSGTSGNTGPNGLGVNHSENGGGPPFNALMPVDSGKTYVINVGNFSSSGNGYDIIFDTNGVISQNTIDAQDEIINCGDQLILDANFNGPLGDTLVYTWSPAIRLNDSSLVNPTTVPLDSTIDYIVKVKNGQCELEDTITVQVVYADFTTLQDTSLCFGIDYKIIPEFEDDIIPSNLSLVWTPDINISNIADTTPTVTTFDTITYYVEIVNGICVEYDSITLSVTDSLAAISGFFINDNFESGGVAEVEFYNNSVGTSINYFWDFADGNNTLEPEPFHVYNDEGTYPVMLKITDTLGCVDSVIMNVVIPILELPNVFTPNGDNVNDIFSIKRLRPESNLRIYNRWGKLVYETLGYDNSWNGDELSDGMYYAELSYQRKAELKIQKGWFEIKR